MRVAYVTPVIPHPRAGFYRSIERIVAAEVGGARARGATLDVFTTFWNGGRDGDEFLGCPVHRFEDTSRRWGRAGRVADMDYLSFGRAVTRALQARSAEFDLVYSQCRLPGIGRLRREGLPVALHFHHKDRMASPLDLARMPFENAANGRAFRSATLVTSSSRAGGDELARHWRVDPSRVRVLHPGLTPPVDRDRPPQAGLHVLFVGTLIARKRADTLIDALARCPEDVTATLVGEGPLGPALKARAKTRGVLGRVRFQSAASEEDLGALYSTAGALALPSAREGFGMVLAEAMAHGTPVVASDIASSRETVGDAGLFFPVGDARALASHLERLRADPASARQLGEAGRQRALARYTWEAHVETMLDIWKEVQG